MEKFRDVLAIVFYLIWIPLGLLLAVGIIVMIVMNPLEMVQDMFSSSMEGLGDLGPGKMDPYGPGPGDNLYPGDMRNSDGLGDTMPSDSGEMMDKRSPAVGFEDFGPPAIDN